MSLMRAVLLSSVLLTWFGSARSEPPVPVPPTGFQLYYGGDAPLLAKLLDRLQKGQVIVVDARALAPADLARLLKAAERVEAWVLGYVSIGELHDQEKESFDQFLKAYLRKHGDKAGAFRTLNAMVVQRNEQFKSDRVDVLAEAWRAYVLAQVAKVHDTGLHGVFLDTVDTVDVYISKKEWPLQRRVKSVQAMVSLVRAIKAQQRSKYVLQNRGLNLIGRTVFVGDATGVMVPALGLAEGHVDNPDAVLWENAFAAQDDWSRRVEKELQAIKKSGRAAVFALGYQATLRSPEDFFRKCAEAGFIAAWASSSEKLHTELTVGPPPKR
jgi:endo-alpha-1,4-polygalactosaminidase (GH114 family)